MTALGLIPARWLENTSFLEVFALVCVVGAVGSLWIAIMARRHRNGPRV